MNTPKTTCIEVSENENGTCDVVQRLKNFKNEPFSLTVHFGLPYEKAWAEGEAMARGLNVPIGFYEIIRAVA